MKYCDKYINAIYKMMEKAIESDNKEYAKALINKVYEDGFEDGKSGDDIEEPGTSKELVYTLKAETEEDHKKAEALRSRLYDKFNNVQVYPNGLHEVRIIAKND